MAQDCLRQAFETIEQGLQFSILLRGGTECGHYLTGEFHVDRLAFGLIRPLEIRSVALVRILAASAAGFAALHHALEKRPLAEVLQLLKLPL